MTNTQKTLAEKFAYDFRDGGLNKPLNLGALQHLKSAYNTENGGYILEFKNGYKAELGKLRDRLTLGETKEEQAQLQEYIWVNSSTPWACLAYLDNDFKSVQNDPELVKETALWETLMGYVMEDEKVAMAIVRELYSTGGKWVECLDEYILNAWVKKHSTVFRNWRLGLIDPDCELHPNQLLSAYFEVDIVFDFGLNKPRLLKQLNKQLKPHGIELTAREEKLIPQAISELSYWGNGSYHFGEDTYIPYDNFDDWAFAGSCNSSGGVGGETPNYLDSSGFEMLRVYEGEDDEPFARAYYLEKHGDFAHAGLYADHQFKFGGDLDHTSYQLTNLLFCVRFGKRLDQFVKIKGFKGLHDQCYIWANMNEQSGYQCYGTAPILESHDMTSPSDYGYVWSELNECYIDLENSVWSDIHDSHLDYYDCNTHRCENCEDYFDSELHDDCVTDRNDNWFCSRDCGMEYHFD